MIGHRGGYRYRYYMCGNARRKGREACPSPYLHKDKMEELQQAKAEAQEVLRYKAVDMADPRVVWDYVNDVRDLLAKSSITERRSFLKSFVEKIEVGDSEVKMYYTIPVPPHSASEETVGVIPFVHHG